MVAFNLCKISSKLFGKVLVVAGQKSQQFSLRGITSKTMRHRIETSTPKPAPFPYKETSYNFLRALVDYPTTSRLDENSKLIVVDGLPTAGKGALAKELADELDMAYLEAPTIAKTLFNEYGFDLRKLDSKLPLDCRSYDEIDFLKNPKSVKAARMQIKLFQLRFKQYIDALAHILNTGQGVVLNRSVFSDFVFMQGMVTQGFVSRNVQSYYYQMKNNSLFQLWRPHLVIYLDVPVEVVRSRIEARNRANEKDSPASTTAYLESLDKAYKQEYLKSMSNHSEMLVYDWAVPSNVETVVEDVERINFEQYGQHDTKLEDWCRIDEWDWNNSRRTFSTQQETLMQFTNVPAISCPEILIDGEDIKVFEKVMNNAPGNKYAKGFNADAGDTSLLFKM
uniref:NADH dehydrogenase [ubiquinone] 1 alpha subcomplex subunit 10, mitochondrial n=1 Tax=Evadne anonyx TaxID=141404 RepID=A0A9N6WXM0_9CRUS|nr:EOG090X05NZ [Evadne anonyx]